MSMTTNCQAACLTPPAIGGIAVIQVTGRDALPLVSRHLRKGDTPVDLSQWAAHQLRLCRVVDGSGVIDDAVVAVRWSPEGVPVVDLNLHGGARIVQRVLLLLQGHGVEIVEPQALLETSWTPKNRLQADAWRLMLRARTRRTAVWLARLPDLLADRLGNIIQLLNNDRMTEAAAELDVLLAGADPLIKALNGVRAVLLGQPNSGKSTLANALAEREQAIVSDIPGTTRDYTEHPSAVQGVPFTIVDTAGLRHTADPIEAEAIRRAAGQILHADLNIRVIDLSCRPDVPNEHFWDQAGLVPEHVPILNVYNKADLPSHPAHGRHSGPADISISAVTGQGLELLRERMLEAVGLTAGGELPVAPFTVEQLEVCGRAREKLAATQPDGRTAACELQKLTGGDNLGKT